MPPALILPPAILQPQPDTSSIYLTGDDLLALNLERAAAQGGAVAAAPANEADDE